MKSSCTVSVSSVACPPLPNFSTLSHKRHDFREKEKKVIGHNDVSHNLFLKYFSFSEDLTTHCHNTWCVQVLRSPKEAFAAAMQSWRERYEKYVCLQGDYVEK